MPPLNDIPCFLKHVQRKKYLILNKVQSLLKTRIFSTNDYKIENSVLKQSSSL